MIKLPSHLHFPGRVRLCRKQVGRFMMKYGAYGMLFDGIVKIAATLVVGIPVMHMLEEAAHLAGPNGAWIAGIGALFDAADHV